MPSSLFVNMFKWFLTTGWYLSWVANNGQKGWRLSREQWDTQQKIGWKEL